MGFVEVKHGVTRTVLLASRYAVKVPRVSRPGHGFLWTLARGLLANQSERDWSGYDGVAPVLWSLAGLINVYPRCAPPPTGDIDYTAILGFPTPVDAKPHNVGLLDSRLVWLDYDMNWNDCHRCNAPVVDPAVLAMEEET